MRIAGTIPHPLRLTLHWRTRQYSINFRGRNGLDRGVDRLVSMSEYVAHLRYQLAAQPFLHGNTSYAMAA